MRLWTFIALFLNFEVYGALLDCHIPEVPDAIIRGIYHSKSFNDQVYLHLPTRNGLRTYKLGASLVVDSEGKHFITKGENKLLMVKIDLNGGTSGQRLKPPFFHSQVRLTLAGTTIFSDSRFLCRTFRKWPN